MALVMRDTFLCVEHSEKNVVILWNETQVSDFGAYRCLYILSLTCEYCRILDV